MKTGEKGARRFIQAKLGLPWLARPLGQAQSALDEARYVLRRQLREGLHHEQLRMMRTPRRLARRGTVHLLVDTRVVRTHVERARPAHAWQRSL